MVTYVSNVVVEVYGSGCVYIATMRMHTRVHLHKHVSEWRKEVLAATHSEREHRGSADKLQAANQSWSP